MVLLGLLGLLGAACAGDPAPSATIDSVTPDRLIPSDDSLDDLTITLRYDDSDGDLGGGVADVYDCRTDGVMIELAIPPIAADKDLHITGTLELHVNDIGALATGVLPQPCADLGVKPLAANDAVFCVVLVDAAGHRGGGDCTKPIELVTGSGLGRARP
jgi:hypothetical protein